ncbi:MAG: protein-tyrosine-phosphatase [Saprospirales bacterium]|nr:protein-tyrosine-phosphatase [Saprospirales bacterium]
MFPLLSKFIHRALKEEKKISEGRKADLARLADFIRAQRQEGHPVQLLFVCTQNSRRSQMAQIWAAAAAAWFDLGDTKTFSGGTEVSAFNPRAVEALIRAGFHIHDFGGENPRYRVTYAEEGPAMVCYSKRYDDPANPMSGFVAIMVCSDADQACPFVPGAAFRLSLPYEDPKVADGKASESAAYDKRSLQIASEILYLLGLVKGASN